jgi:hypothetical protein
MPGGTPKPTGGGEGNRTPVQGFAGPCLNHSATPPEGDNHSGHSIGGRSWRSPGSRSSGASTAVGLLAELDVGLTAWLASGSTELEAQGVTPEQGARLVRRSLLALVTEHLATGSVDVDAHATELAHVVFGREGASTRLR